jgi:hypothetical protein
MQSYSEHNPRWSELLHKAVTEPGVVSTAFSRFHRYSMGNQLLALSQCERRGIEPGPMATFPGWKEQGRYVKRGQKALTLCMPITIKRASENKDEQTEPEQCFTRFVYKNHWFVLSQTDGAEYKPEPVPEWDAEKALSAMNIERVPFAIMDGNVQGYAKHRTVAINPVAEQPESTLFHELAHIILGHTSEGSLTAPQPTARLGTSANSKPNA